MLQEPGEDGAEEASILGRELGQYIDTIARKALRDGVTHIWTFVMWW